LFFVPRSEAGNQLNSERREVVAVYAAAAAALLIWAGTPVANKLAVVTIDSATTGMMRSVLAGPIALVVALALRLPFPREPAHLVLLLLSGITSFAIWPTLLSIGIQLTSANHAALIIAIIPVFTGLFVAAYDRQWPPVAWWAGISIAGMGTAFLVFHRTGYLPGPEAAAETGTDGASVTGDLIIVAGTIVCAVGYVTGAKLSPLIGNRATTFWGLTVAAAAMVPVVLINADSTNWSGVTTTSWMSLAYLAYMGSFMGYLLWFLALGRGGITRMSAWQLGQPAVTFVLAAAVLGETVTLPLVISGLVILGGTALAQRPA
jgi:drug/metabolite transporter (DMT)-like permease